ncbi:MAG: hypothetical protein HFG56_10375 [Lachnospiraceae bacterium]|jgi:hypothetical protein|nr:hypothetical protein [Lachnospiraceae bacterium]MCI9283669.1 hypothetical protein [Lachnospiraceae bacterium]
MSKYFIARNEDITIKYKEDGFFMTEVLAGSYDGGIRNYKCFLRAGSEIRPALYREETVVYMFGKGRGYITDTKEAHNITELSFYLPNFDQDPFTIHAIEDMEFIMSVVEMNPWDKERFAHSHIHLPFFLKYTDGQIYDQDCKGPNTTSWLVIGPGQMGRILMGVVRATGEGTDEKGHPAVAQWNYSVGDSDFHLCVDHQPSIVQKSGDFSFVPAGPDHSLVADPGKEVFYVWYEHYTRERDFMLTLAKGDKLEDKLKH